MTLLESVLALGLLGLVLLLVSKLLVDVAKVNARANKLTWKVTASEMLDQIEFEARMAYSVEFNPAFGEEVLTLTTRDVSHQDFLAIGPTGALPVDSERFVRTVTYGIDGDKLQRRIESDRVRSTTVLGKADKLEVQQLIDGSFSMVLEKDGERLRRDFRSLTR